MLWDVHYLDKSEEAPSKTRMRRMKKNADEEERLRQRRSSRKMRRRRRIQRILESGRALG